MRGLAFALLLIAGACGGPADEPTNVAANGRAGPENGAAAAAYPPPTAAEIEAARAAAAAVARYYELIGRREWAAAFALREPRRGITLDRFIERYAPYQHHGATVGMPSRPAERDGTLWVRVPVQLYGRGADGAPFGSVVTVTMKRRAGERAWKVAT